MYGGVIEGLDVHCVTSIKPSEPQRAAKNDSTSHSRIQCQCVHYCLHLLHTCADARFLLKSSPACVIMACLSRKHVVAAHDSSRGTSGCDEMQSSAARPGHMATRCRCPVRLVCRRMPCVKRTFQAAVHPVGIWVIDSGGRVVHAFSSVAFVAISDHLFHSQRQLQVLRHLHLPYKRQLGTWAAVYL